MFSIEHVVRIFPLLEEAEKERPSSRRQKSRCFTGLHSIKNPLMKYRGSWCRHRPRN